MSFAGAGAIALDAFSDPARSFEAQLCGIPRSWLELTQRGYERSRAGQIALLPRQPIYMSTGALGWTHSGPWDYLQRVPLVFYGPGRVPAGIDIDDPVTTADIAPTIAAMLDTDVGSDGVVLADAVGQAEDPPRVVVTVVWDGGGWNGLMQWPGAWPNLARLMARGVNFTNARVGSSPSVTPAVHTTLGTGYFPATHGVTGVPVRDESGTVVDSFNDGKSARFIEVPALAETWDASNDNDALIAMIGYEPWHLGMIGKGAETPSGDKDDAVWVNRGSNHWVTNRDHYSIPTTFRDQSDIQARLDELDTEDGKDDDRWGRVPLDERTRIEETPAFVDHHGQKLVDLIDGGGYGADRVTDLLFTNFKQIDRVAHYYNMDAPEVRDVMVATDEQLGGLVDALDSEVGRSDYVVVVTADHGMQPDDEALDSYAIDPNEVERDIAARFGPVVRAVWPTEIFMLEEEMAAREVTLDEVASFLSEYRIRDNTSNLRNKVLGSGSFSPNDRVFELAAPATMLETVSC